MERKLQIGQKVYWADPDSNISSGYYSIVSIKNDIITIANNSSVAEVYDYELREYYGR